MAVTGGEIVARMLAAEGVDTVFGIIDGTYFGFYSSFEEHGITLVSPRHETSALHMAGAYARMTGRLGVAMASNGPGVANALPGVAVEQGEGHRVLLITSARRTGISYPDRDGTFQYFNQSAVIGPMTKSSEAVPARDRIPDVMRRAFRTSWSGRPGVVHVDVPENIMNGDGKFNDAEVRSPNTYRRVEHQEPDPVLVQRTAQALAKAERPLLHAGTGVIHAGAHAELQAVAERLGAPITTSWGGRGAVAEVHPLSISMTQIDLYQQLRNDADAVLILGSRVGETDWWGKPPYWAPATQQTTIQVDIDDATIGATRPIDIGVPADIKVFLRRLIDAIDAGPPITKQPDAWTAPAAEARAKLAKKADKPKDGVSPGRIPGIAQSLAPDDTIWVFDGGNTTVWSHFYHETKQPNSLLTTYKFGMLGAGVAQALGAQVAAPERRVVCLIGDGAMGFHPQELETAVRNGLPVVYIVFVDRQWGMVKMNQQFALKPVKTIVRKSLSEAETINADFSEIRFDDLARSMGAHGERVSRESDLAAAIERALDSGKPAVVHVDVDPVAHMWAPALRTFKDMHQEPKG